MMKKVFALLMAVLLCVGLLAACGGNNTPAESGSDSGNTATEAGNNTPDGGNTVSGETFDVGKITVLVPEGWKAVTVKEFFAEDENALDPGRVNIVKGGESEIDLFSQPYINIAYYDAGTDMIAPPKEMYQEVEDVDDMTIGSYTWHAFKCDSYGYKYYILWTGEEGGDQFTVSVLYKSTNGSFNFDDADVQAILASIKTK